MTSNSAEELKRFGGRLIRVTVGLDHLQIRTDSGLVNIFTLAIARAPHGDELGRWVPDTSSINAGSRFAALIPDEISKTLLIADGRLTILFATGEEVEIVPDLSGERAWEAQGRDWSITCWPNTDGSKVFSDVTGDVALPGDETGTRAQSVRWTEAWAAFEKDDQAPQRKHDNPFIELQRQRRVGPKHHNLSALVRLLRERLGKPRVFTLPWEKAWRVAFGHDRAGYLIGLDAWYPLRKTMTAAEFIARYVTDENRQ